MNEPEVIVKLVEADIVPDDKVNVAAAECVQVVQEIVPILLKVPAVNVAAPELVKLNVAKLIVPAVCTYDVHPNAAAKVTVPAPLFTVNAAIVLPLGVMVPVPTAFILKEVKVPPVDSVKPFKFNVVAAIANAVVPKFKMLNQLAVVMVAIAVPAPVKERFGAFVVVPPVVPNVNVLVIEASAENPPVPVQVNPVAVAKFNTVVAAVVCVSNILPTPNKIERVAVPDEVNIPVFKLKPLSANVPLVIVVVALVTKVNASPSVVVPDVLLMFKAAIVLAVETIVPVPTMFIVNPVYVPPVDNVKSPAIFNVAVAGVVLLPVKTKLFNQLAVVIVGIAAPLGINKLAVVVAEPPVVPIVYVLVIEASALKPPVPEEENKVLFAILTTTAPTVVVIKLIKLAPNATDLAVATFELNIPVDKSKPLSVNAPFVNVVVSVAPVTNALPKLQPPPTPLNVIAPFIVVPLVVIVLPVVVALNVIAPVLLQTVPATNDIEPVTANVGVVPVAKVTTPALTVISKHSKAPVIVTV